MLPRDLQIKNLAWISPKIAYGLVAQVPRVPFVGPITTNPGVPSPVVPIQFTANWLAPPALPPGNPPNNIGINPIIQGTLQNNVTQDTLIERIVYSLWQPNAFSTPPSPFQTLYLSQLKSSTGVDVLLDVYGSPKYRVCDFLPLENLADVLAVTWPNGWPLRKQENVKVQAVLTRPQPGTVEAPVGIPYFVNMALVGWQFVGKEIDDMSDDEARRRLKAMGIEVPEVPR